MIKINKSPHKVYIICPANVATGGPELLHQLAASLIKMGIKSFMFYLPSNIENPVHPNYVQYNTPFVREVENSPENLIIIPESYPEGIFIKDFSKMQKVIWWLSVDNYFTAVNALIDRHKHKLAFSLKQLINYYKIPSIRVIAKKKDILHFVQSNYAEDFLNKNNIHKIAYLSDYLNITFLEKTQGVDLLNKQNVVLYNPKKGLDFTKKIISHSPGQIKWIAIENLTPKKVSALLAQSKVYIDFGNHPGKDRFPREAAIMGCCVITGKKGSARFNNDLPINDEFKFDDAEETIPQIISKIENCFANFVEESLKFEHYREKIRNEEEKFNQDLKQIFK